MNLGLGLGLVLSLGLELGLVLGLGLVSWVVNFSTSANDKCTSKAVGLKIKIYESYPNLQNPVSCNQNPPSATKSTSMQRKLSKSNISSNEIAGFHEIQNYLRNPCIRTQSVNIRLGF